MIAELVKQGVDIRSYYHWSLMDNFEWSEGYTMRFGLYHVDYENQTRTLRESGKIYQQIIKQSKLWILSLHNQKSHSIVRVKLIQT